MPLTDVLYELTDGDYRAQVSEVGAGLAGLWLGSRPVTSPWPDGTLPPMSSGAVLLPWPNRIRDGKYSFGGRDLQLPLSEPANHNASHGLARWVRWRVSGQTAGSLTLVDDLVPQTGYPFQLSFQITYSLSAETGLSVVTTARNVGDAAAPFGAGFHPYLDLDGADIPAAVLGIPAETRLVTDERQIPTGTEAVAGTDYDRRTAAPIGALQLDDAFTDLTADRLDVLVDDRRTTIWWSEQFRYLQVFTPPIQRFGRTAVAVEPMTCPANAFNSGDGLITLEPGAEWTGTWGITAV